MASVAAAASNVAGTTAVIKLALKSTEVSTVSVPATFAFTTDPLKKLAPETVKVVAPAPCVTATGNREYRTGNPGAITKLTLMVCVGFEAPAAARVIFPAYVPGKSPVGSATAATVAGKAANTSPVGGVTRNQLPVDVADVV